VSVIPLPVRSRLIAVTFSSASGTRPLCDLACPLLLLVTSSGSSPCLHRFKKVIPIPISKVMPGKACRLTWDAGTQLLMPLRHHSENRVVSTHLLRPVRYVEQHTGPAEPSEAFVQQPGMLSWT
jgi:hypothetical protein